ncbi:BnaC06g03300D [Brassica napus]|uniref:(rape) hypothetical protein n=1 Tax=Brassica napus TaxID=3708 RepID=A0A078I0G2_BRANA|nr:unnamed protein product [Brassica napus]CDY42528.1 BnaC06g03300D [Brassica napus]
MGGCVSLDLSCDQTLKQTYHCLFGDGNNIHMMKPNLEALETTMQELRERRDDIARRYGKQVSKKLLELATCTQCDWQSHVIYDGLGNEKMKSCFLYCSLFPENYEIKKEELIEYWISEGFINGERDEDGSNNEGHDIIGSLVCAHLLMESETAVKMHDVLREMALWIGSTSGKEEEK